MNRRLVALAPLAAAAALLAFFPAPVGADAVDDAVKNFEDYLKNKPESQGLRNQIAELSLKKDPRVAEALKPLLKHKDDDVKIAVAQNIGKQGDPKIVPILKQMIDMKDMDEKPKVMAALIEGVGDAAPKANYEFLIKLAKKYLDQNQDIASAAYRAAANWVTAETVDDLVAELGRADYVTQNDNAVKKASRGACRPVIQDLLKKITGQNISDVKIWKEWWDKEKKTWKPPVSGTGEKKDINASDEFSDSAYGFVIKRPSRAWLFRKQEGNNPYLVLEALDEGQRAAWIDLTVLGTKNLKSRTADAMAEEWKGILEGKFRDIKEGAEWAKKTRVSGKNAVEQILFGAHKDFDAVAMHNVYMEEGEVMYMFHCYWKSGKPQALKDDIETILKTFKLTR
ncbi:MAG: HEAT repeat domain-containing protein [Planctomycetes bacterium]|nr:HEAT repeat domain-containing protein [Planctomycetota bacterium]